MTLAICVIAFSLPRLGGSWFGIIERKCAPLARKQRLAVLATGVAAVVARLAVLPILPIPHPFLPDEFSFLLGANTFARGRLTNPTPAMWIHFETLHVLMKPTFMSMYPPGQTLFLAAGKVAAGLPFAGVLLSVGLMCAAITWMLQGWFSPGWAFLGGMIAVMRFGVFSYWANSYWGGAVAALGGALVLGALPRILRFERPADAVWMGLGLAILANSRPYEGLVLSLPVAFVLFAWFFKKRGAALARTAGRAIAPLTLVVLLAAAGTGYYCWRVTGSPFHMPEQVDWQEYSVAPILHGEATRPVPIYHQVAMRNFYLQHQLAFYEEGRTFLGLLGIDIVKFVDLWLFFLGPVLTLPLLVLILILPRDSIWARCDWRMRFLIVATAVSLAGLMVEVFYFDHYAAPMTCLILALAIEAMRRVRAWRPRGRPAGRFISRAVPAICLLMLFVRAGATTLHLPITPTWPPTPYNSVGRIADFTRVNRELDAHPGKHLVLLRYVHNAKTEGLWVYNENGDMHQERNVWAWDMGPKKNRELIRHYKNRDVWLVVPSGSRAKLSRYSDPPTH